jgi:hypothetical protein
MRLAPNSPIPRAPEKEIDPEQSWFSSDEWLNGEREASQQIADGQTYFYEDEDALERAFAERKQRSNPNI